MKVTTHHCQGRSEDFGEGGALSGAERQIVPLVARVRRREAPPIEQWQGSGGARRSPRWGFGGEAPNGGLGGRSPPENFWHFWVILD